MKSRYIPTISSFYTLALNRRKEDEIPSVPSLPKPHVVDPTSITPYLCLRPSLTQIVFNKLTLIFIFTLLYLHAFASAVQWGLSSTKSSLLAVCAASAASVDTGAPLASVVANSTQSALTSAVAAIDRSTQSALNTTVSSIIESAADYITQLQALYEFATNRSFSGVANAAIASVKAQQTPVFPKETVSIPLLASSRASLAGGCRSEPQISSYFTDLANSVHVLEKKCLALLIVLALLCYLPATLHTWYHWKSKLHQAKVLHSLEFSDSMDNIDMACNPAVTWLGVQVSKRFFPHKDSCTSRVRWTINYVLSPAMLFLLQVGLLVLLTSVCLATVAAPLFQSPDSSFTTLSASSNATSLSQWASRCNDALSKAESSLNEKYAQNINEYTRFISDTLDVYVRSMDDQLGSVNPPNLTLFNAHVQLTNITYPQIDFTSLPNDQSIYQQTTRQALSSLCSALDQVVTAHVQIGVAFISFWVGVSIAISAYSIFQYRRR